MPLIVKEGIWADNGDVIVDQRSLAHSPETLHDALNKAFERTGHQLLSKSGGESPATYASVEEFDHAVAQYEKECIAANATKARKKRLTKARRIAFNSRRAQIELALIASGESYICAHPECETANDLTIDHITPLSKGGSDDLYNLQFMCLSHNSQKGDR